MDANCEGIQSLLDTDLYKLTMQCCVLKYFRDTEVSYNFTNRTPNMKFNREAVTWLRKQISGLENLRLTSNELDFLKSKCPFLTIEYLDFLQGYSFRPAEHVKLEFHPIHESGTGTDIGSIELHIAGLWLETILYEIPVLALISEAYFRYVDCDWNYDGQVDNSFEKGKRLLEGGCVFSEFGTRRRRSHKAQELVLRGLVEASHMGKRLDWPGQLSGTSNVHFAMLFNLCPIGTVAHEWFMAIAAITDDYEHANELAMQYWLGTFGPGVLGIALTDTFGTKSFLRAFALPAAYPKMENLPEKISGKSYSDLFTGVRQDSGDPKEFVKMMKFFCESEGHEKKLIVFSDSLDVGRCLEYKLATESAGFMASFGIGTFLTNDFVKLTTGEKSIPLNIVIKLASAGGNPAVKISDNKGKNTGDMEKVLEVKKRLGYEELAWEDGDEASRWKHQG